MMRLRYVFPFAVALCVALPVYSQRREEREKNPPRANQGHVPEAPPPPRESRAKPEVERRESGHVNTTPHVSNDHWYGHDRPNDKRFHLDHPFEHGRFEHFGPSYRYRIERFDRDHHRFWLPGGFFFEVAAWDWPIGADWCWDCGDDFVVYEDPDHDGWYMLYNVHIGVYVHVNYMGP
jgi:hypothetical protein